MSSPAAPRVFRLDVCRICGFDVDGDDQSENGDYCFVCGFCLLRPVAPKRAPPPAPSDAAAKNAAPPSVSSTAAAAAAASPSAPLSAAPSSHAPSAISGQQGKAPPPKRPPPPVPMMQIESVLQAFAKHDGSLESFDAPVIPGALPSESALANAAPLAATTSDAEQLQRAQAQDQRATSSKKQSGTGESPPPPQQQQQQVLTVKTSKYDVVKVRMWRGGHFHVLSRYLLARVLSESGLGRADAVRLALAAKKRLVDAGRLDVPEEECGALLRSMLREAGHAAAVPAFDMLREWGARRSPLLVLVCGSALAGKAALSTALAHHLNLAAMIQAANVYRVACSIDEEQSAGGSGVVAGQQPPREEALYLRAWSSPSELEAEYSRRCLAVRRGLARDVDKALAEGRSVLIEGSLLDPTLFRDLLPLCAPVPLPTHAPSSPSRATAPATPASVASVAASAGPVPPIVVSFHVTLSPERQRLLLHNHFSTAESLAPPSIPAAVPAPPHAPSAASASASSAPPAHVAADSPVARAGFSGLEAPVPGSGPGPASAPVSHATIWRNLRWLEEIVAARHQRWREMICEHNERVRAATAAAASAAAGATSPTAAPAAPSPAPCPQVPQAQSVPLDNLHAAVESMRATVLDAIAAQFQQEGRGRTASEAESERDEPDSWEKGGAAAAPALDSEAAAKRTAAAAAAADQAELQRKQDEAARALVAQQQQQQRKLQERQEKEEAARAAAARATQLAEEAKRAETARVLAETQLQQQQQQQAAEAKRRAEEAAAAEARAQSLAAAEKQKQLDAETTVLARQRAAEQQRVAAEAARAEAAAAAAAAAEAAARAQAAERARLEQQRQAEMEASQRARAKQEAEEQAERARRAARDAEEKALRERLEAEKRAQAAAEAARVVAPQKPHQPQAICVDDAHCGGGGAGKPAPVASQAKAPEPQPQPRRSSLSKSTALAMSRFEIASHAAEDAAELKVQARLNAAVQWVDKEIRKLISEILKASAADSSSGSSSSPSVLYGSLFESTQNSMEALSGTLMTAKRRGVVSYDGSLLLQRVHDQVRITLLKREIPDSPLPDHSKRKASPIKPDAFATAQIIGNEKCFKCHKTVYQSERVGAAGKTYHAECFRCAHCHVILATATFCNNQVSNYCPSCYQMLVNKHGANF